jgi:hypothetical protein
LTITDGEPLAQELVAIDFGCEPRGAAGHLHERRACRFEILCTHNSAARSLGQLRGAIPLAAFVSAVTSHALSIRSFRCGT